MNSRSTFIPLLDGYVMVRCQGLGYEIWVLGLVNMKLLFFMCPARLGTWAWHTTEEEGWRSRKDNPSTAGGLLSVHKAGEAASGEEPEKNTPGLVSGAIGACVRHWCSATSTQTR